MKRFLSVLLAVLMVFSSAVSYAAPSIAGVADSLFEAPSYEEPAADETSSLSAEVASVTSEYGALVVKFTFDDLTAGDWTTDAQTVGNTASATNRLSDVGGIWGSGDFMATADTNSAFIFDEIKATTVTVVEETDGNKYLQLTGTGAAGYFGIGDYNGGGFVQSVANGYGGHIIFTADVLSSSNTKPFTKARFNRAGENTKEGYFRIHENIDQDATLGEWSTVVVSFDDTNDTVDGTQEAYTSAWNATTNRAMLYHALAEGEIAGIDNLTMWLVPNEVEVTVDHGSYADNETVTIGGGIKTAAEIKAAITTAPEGYFLKGIKTSEDGELLADDDTVIINGIDEVTIYAVWAKQNILKSYEFTSGTEGLAAATARATTEHDSTLSDGVLKLTAVAAEANTYLAPSCSIDVSQLEDIQVRIMYSETDYDNSSITLDSNYVNGLDADGNTLTDVGIGSGTYTATNDEWTIISYKDILGDLSDYFDSKSVATLTTLRVSLNADLVEIGDIAYIDYIRFIGEPLPRVYVDAANDTFSDYDYYYDSETTVADVLEQLTADEVTAFFGKTLKTSDGTILETSDLISEVAEDEDTLTVVYGKYNDFGFDFDTASANGDVNGGTLAARFDATVVDDEDNAGNTLTEFTAATSLSTDSVRVGLRSDRGRMYINNLGIDAGKLEKILIKMRFTEIPEDGEMYTTADGSTYSSSASTYKSATTTHNTFYFTNTGDTDAYAGIGSSNPYTMPEENVYVIETISGDTNCGISTGVTTSGIELSSFDFDQFRYDFPAAPEGFTVQVDEVLFLSNDTLTQYEINNEGDTETYYFDTATAVSEILADFASADDTLAARALRYGDTILSGDDTLESIPEYATLEVLYSTDIIKSYEFTSDTEGVSYNRGVTNSWEDGCLVIDYSTATTLTNAHADNTIATGGIAAGNLKNIKARLKFVGMAPSNFKQYNYAYIDGTVVGSGYAAFKLTAADGEWIDVDFVDRWTQTKFDNYFGSGNLTHLRFDLTSSVSSSDVKIYIDYIRFIGDAQPVVVLDMGDLADDIYIPYTSSTTVADLIEAAGFESDAVSLDGVTYSGTTYGATDTIESILAGDDAVVNIAYSNKKTLELDLGTIGLDLDGKVSFTNAGYYDGTTTVGDIIDAIVISGYSGLYELKGLSADASRTVLDESVSFADIAVNDKVTLTAIWRKINVLFNLEFDSEDDKNYITDNKSTGTVDTENSYYESVHSSSTTDGTYYIKINFKEDINFEDVYDIQYRVNPNISNFFAQYFVIPYIDSANYTNLKLSTTYSITGDTWNDLSFNEIWSVNHAGTYIAEKTSTTYFNGMRFQGPSLQGVDATILYDYIRVIGNPLTEIVVDLSELGLSDLVSGYDDETTVSDILSEIVYDGDKSLDALVYGGKQYTGDTTIKSILNGAEGTFTVKAVSPKYVTVMDGETALLSDVAVTGTMTLADVVAKLDTTDLGTKKLLGLAAAADATEALDSTSLAGNACTYTDNGTKSLGTLYVVYEEYTILDIVSTDFADSTELTDISIRVGATQKASTSVPVTFGTDDDGTTYAHLAFTDTTYTAAWDTGFTLNTLNSLTVPAGAFYGFLMRMRFNDDALTSVTDVGISSGETKTYDPASFEHLYWGSTAGSVSAGKETSSIDMSFAKTGEWFTVYYDASKIVATMGNADSLMNAGDLAYLRYDFPNAMPAGSSIDIDYIKLVGDPGQLPNTTIYRIDMTTNNDKASDVTIPSKYTTLEEDATAIVIEPGETLTLSDFSSQIVDEGELDFVGFNTDKDATTALDATTLGAVNGGEAITLYAIWNEYDYNTLYSLDFETNSGWGMGAADSDGDGVYKTDLSTLGGHGSVYQANYNADSTITAKDSGFITHNAEEGYITAHFDASAAAKEAIDADTDTTYTSNGYAVSDARITIATVDNEAYIPAGKISKVIVRARINGIENYTEAQNYWFKFYRADQTAVKWGSFNPEGISLPQLYVTYDSTTNAGGTNGKLYNHTLKAVTNDYIRNGEWFTYEFDASEFGADVNDIHWMRFDFNDTMPDGTSIDIDFIRFVGTDMAAPETHEDRTSVRLGTGEDARNGIRVIASLNPGIYDADATDIGWMFSSSKRWYAAGYTMDELTMDKDDDTSLIVPGYVRQNGVKMAEFFDDTADTEWFFSAVLYNIPVKNYKSPFIVRPFVKIYGAYAYGEAFETNFLDFADAAYDSCSDGQKAYIDACRESYDTYLAQQEISGDIETNFTDLLAEPTSLLSATIIPTNDTAPVVSGNYVTLTAWKDGAITTVDVYTTGTYPAIMNDDGSLSEYYADKPCVIAQVPDIEGEIYYLKSLANSGSADGVIGDINLNSHHTDWGKDVDATSMFVSQVDEMASPFQRFDRYYQSDSSNCVPVNKDSFFLGDFELGTYSHTLTAWSGSKKTYENAGKTAYMTDDTTFVVKYVWPDGTSEWATYDAAALNATGVDGKTTLNQNIEFSNLTYVVSDNLTNTDGESSATMEAEDLVLLAGVVDVPEYVTSVGSGLDASMYGRIRIKVAADKLPSSFYEVNKSLTSSSNVAYTFNLKFTKNGTTTYTSYSVTDTHFGLLTDGSYVLDFDMTLVPEWQGTITDVEIYGTCTYKKNWYSSSTTATMDLFDEATYVRYLKTSDKSINDDLSSYSKAEVFEDGNFVNGIDAGTMESGFSIITGDDKFVTTDSTEDASWKFFPGYTYDYTDAKAALTGWDLSLTHADRFSLIQTAYDSDNSSVPFYTDYEMKQVSTTNGTALFKDNAESKVVEYRPGETITYADGTTTTGDVLSLGLNCTKIFNGEDYYKYNPSKETSGDWYYWPHLLIDQPQSSSLDGKLSCDADRFYAEFDIRLASYSAEYVEGELGESDHMSFLLYSYIVPKDLPEQKIWFGLNLAGDESSTPSSAINWCRDSGANTHMYCLSSEMVYGGVENSMWAQINNGATSTDWMHVKVDLTAHVQQAIDWVNSEDAFGIGVTTLSDWCFNGVNIGFECQDNVDCTFELANFNFYAYNPQ